MEKKRGKAKRDRDDDDSSSSYENPKSRVKSNRHQVKSTKPAESVVIKEPKPESKPKDPPIVK
jgi:hypothetical protein